MEVFATVYREELKRFGIEVVVAVAGNMKTGGRAKTAAALARTAKRMTPEEHKLYGQVFNAFAAKLNSMQSTGLASIDAAKRVVELAEQNPPQRSASVGEDADEILHAVRKRSEDELDALRRQIVGPE